MSSKKRKKSQSKVTYDPGLLKSRKIGTEGPAVDLVGQSHCSLQFGDGGTPPATSGPDTLDRRKKLAIMLSRLERESRPWCEECNVHKVSRSAEGTLDTMCGICSKVAAEHGPRNILAWHDHYCGSCQNKKSGIEKQETNETR